MPAIEQVYEQICEFARMRGAKRVTLFGSRARGTASRSSDIDIAVEGCGDFRAFYDDVSERLWSLVDIDVVNLDECTSPELLRRILREGKVIYEKV